MTAKEEMWNHVLTKAPALKKLIDHYGDMSLWEYARKFYPYNGSISAQRKDEFLDYIGEYVHEHHGESIKQKTLESLNMNYCISTADHHGPIGHPFFFQSAILRGLTRPGEAIVNLCTSHVSLGNSSYPRGFVFHESNKKSYSGIPLFPAYERMSSVIGHQSFQEQDIKKCLSLIKQKKDQGSLDEQKYSTLYNWIQRVLLSEEMLGKETYSEQITMINSVLWDDIFGTTMPSFVSLDGEKAVSYILTRHLKKDFSVLKNMLTELSWQEEIEKYFDTLGCCFDRKKNKGTYLFWYRDTQGKRISLWRSNDTLISNDKTVQIPLNTAAIINGIHEGYLIPSGLLMYSTLACYYGVTCFGGFAQGTYLPQIFAAYSKIVEKSGESASIQPDILCEDIILALDKEDRIMTALDMLTADDQVDIEKLLQNAKNTTLQRSIELMLPEITRCL